MWEGIPQSLILDLVVLILYEFTMFQLPSWYSQCSASTGFRVTCNTKDQVSFILFDNKSQICDTII